VTGHLEAHGIPRDKTFAEKVPTRVRVRPKFETALEAVSADQGPRPALPGDPDRERDETARPRLRRADRARRGARNIGAGTSSLGCDYTGGAAGVWCRPNSGPSTIGTGSSGL